jgi:hypothetical protein
MEAGCIPTPIPAAEVIEYLGILDLYYMLIIIITSSVNPHCYIQSNAFVEVLRKVVAQ